MISDVLHCMTDSVSLHEYLHFFLILNKAVTDLFTFAAYHKVFICGSGILCLHMCLLQLQVAKELYKPIVVLWPLERSVICSFVLCCQGHYLNWVSLFHNSSSHTLLRLSAFDIFSLILSLGFFSLFFFFFIWWYSLSLLSGALRPSI